MPDHQRVHRRPAGRVPSALCRGQDVGPVTNGTGVLADLSPNIDAFRSVGILLTALFGLDHGVLGSARAGGRESETAVHDPGGLPVYETYQRSGERSAAPSNRPVWTLCCTTWPTSGQS